MAASPQTVIYRFDGSHTPAWQFHSMPESAVGGAATLDEAREQYREALGFLLDTDRLPKIREYVEREAHLGIWVRTLLGDPRGEALVQEVANQLSHYPPEDLDWFYDSSTAGGDPVIFHGQPDDPLASVFAQMTPFDSIVLLAGLGDGGPKPKKLMWLVVTGFEASIDQRYEPMNLRDLGLAANTPLNEVFLVALQHYQSQHGDDLQSLSSRPPALLAPA